MKTTNELALAAGFDEADLHDDGRLERFAALVRAQALEEAAKVCDGVAQWDDPDGNGPGVYAQAIRGLTL